VHGTTVVVGMTGASSRSIPRTRHPALATAVGVGIGVLLVADNRTDTNEIVGICERRPLMRQSSSVHASFARIR